MAEIINFQIWSLGEIWRLCNQYWFLTAIPVSMIIIIVIYLIKGAVNR